MEIIAHVIPESLNTWTFSLCSCLIDLPTSGTGIFYMVYIYNTTDRMAQTMSLVQSETCKPVLLLRPISAIVIPQMKLY